MGKKSLGLVGILMSMCCMLLLQGPVHAVEGESIVMSPASIPLDISSGTTSNGTFTLLNDGTSGYEFKVYAAPYSVANHTYEADFSTRNPTTDIYTWITFDKQIGRLEPGQSLTVQYSIQVPADAAPGGHYAAIFAETQETPSGQIARKKRVGAVIYATVEGNYVRAGRELEVKIDPIQFNYPLSGLMTVENTGNTDFTMTKTLRVSSIFGGTVYEKQMEHIIMPKTTRDVPLVWDNGAWLGWYKVHTESKILDKVAAHDTLVFIAPLWFIALAVLIVAALFYHVIRRFRK